MKCSCGKDAGTLGCKHLGSCEEIHLTPVYVVCDECESTIIVTGLSAVGLDFFTPICRQCLDPIVADFLDENVNTLRAKWPAKWYEQQRRISEAKTSVKH